MTYYVVLRVGDALFANDRGVLHMFRVHAVDSVDNFGLLQANISGIFQVFHACRQGSWRDRWLDSINPNTVTANCDEKRQSHHVIAACRPHEQHTSPCGAVFGARRLTSPLLHPWPQQSAKER